MHAGWNVWSQEILKTKSLKNIDKSKVMKTCFNNPSSLVLYMCSQLPWQAYYSKYGNGLSWYFFSSCHVHHKLKHLTTYIKIKGTKYLRILHVNQRFFKNWIENVLLLFLRHHQNYVPIYLSGGTFNTGRVSLLMVPLMDYRNGKIVNCILLKTTFNQCSPNWPFLNNHLL